MPKRFERGRKPCRRGERKFEQLLPLCSPQTLALVREFQNAVVRDLVERAMLAAEELAVESVLVSGGVAANSQLRATFEERAMSKGIEVFFPEPGAFDGQRGDDRCGGVRAISRGHFCRCICSMQIRVWRWRDADEATVEKSPKRQPRR